MKHGKHKMPGGNMMSDKQMGKMPKGKGARNPAMRKNKGRGKKGY